MTFSPERTIGDVEQDFHRAFPHLKLELFHHGHAKEEGSPISDRIHPKEPLSDYISNTEPVVVELDPETTVRDFEQGLFDLFQMGAQVFRHMGDTFIMTTKTDHKTLGEQEALGERTFASMDHLHDGE